MYVYTIVLPSQRLPRGKASDPLANTAYTSTLTDLRRIYVFMGPFILRVYQTDALDVAAGVLLEVAGKVKFSWQENLSSRAEYTRARCY